GTGPRILRRLPSGAAAGRSAAGADAGPARGRFAVPAERPPVARAVAARGRHSAADRHAGRSGEPGGDLRRSAVPVRRRQPARSRRTRWLHRIPGRLPHWQQSGTRRARPAQPGERAEHVLRLHQGVNLDRLTLRGLIEPQRWRRRLRDALELFALPLACTLLPWALTLRLLRWLSRFEFWHRQEVQISTAKAAQFGMAPDPAVFARRLRWRLLIEHMDCYLVPMRSRRYLRRWLRVT